MCYTRAVGASDNVRLVECDTAVGYAVYEQRWTSESRHLTARGGEMFDTRSDQGSEGLTRRRSN